MGNEQASRVVHAPGIKTNQDELARPPMMRYSIGDEDTGYFSENRKYDNAVMNAATERSSAASFQILPPKQAEVFRTPEECHKTNRPTDTLITILRTPMGGGRRRKYEMLHCVNFARLVWLLLVRFGTVASSLNQTQQLTKGQWTS